MATAAYEDAREAILAFARHSGRDDVAIICRNTTEAINHLAYRLRLEPSDVVVTTVVEHHANLLPWGRLATRRFVECSPDGTFEAAALREVLDAEPRPRAPGPHRGIEHHRLAAPDRCDHRERARAGRAGPRRRRAASGSRARPPGWSDRREGLVRSDRNRSPRWVDGAAELAVQIGSPHEVVLGEATVELRAHRRVTVEAGVFVSPPSEEGWSDLGAAGSACAEWLRNQ